MNRISGQINTFSVFTLLSFFSVGSFAQSNQVALIDSLNKCAGVSDATARLACFDSLVVSNAKASQQNANVIVEDENVQVIPKNQKTVITNQGAVVETTPETVITNPPSTGGLPEALGSGRKKVDKQRAKQRDEGSRGLVVRCQKTSRDRIFFIFEGGQVWKQVKPSARNRKIKECNFYATITKDGFGYKLKIDDQKWSTRVKRHK